MKFTNNKPILVVMAAGIGSRYGGLKQIDPVGPNGEIIIDYSLYDAHKAGFETAVCIIKHEIADEFKAVMDKGAAKNMNILYVYQEMINNIPADAALPVGRTKPWGTGHAILQVKDLLNSPFAIINADDYYGSGIFRKMYNYLYRSCDKEKYDYCMAGYEIENTVSKNGTVTRGVCSQNADGYLRQIIETTNIRQSGGHIEYTDEDGSSVVIPNGTPVSMNMFGFTPSILDELAERFPVEFDRIIRENPLKGEFLIPDVVEALLREKKASVKIIPCHDKWYGVTYKDDKPVIMNAMKQKIAYGEYPEQLWG